MASERNAAPSLMVISSAPADVRGNGLLLDKKFVEGMRLYAANWPGRVGCLLPEIRTDQPFGEVFDPSSLPFEIALHPRGCRITAAELDGYDVFLCSGDSEQYLHLAETCRKEGKSLFFTIENIPATRRQIVMLERGLSRLKKLKSILKIHYHERRRRRAFTIADGLQANGYPAAGEYRSINGNILLYLDNRIDSSLLATQSEMAARRHHLESGGRLRLIHSGRLEPLKGSGDLVPIARRLRDQGVDFVLDVFGAGSLEPQIRAEVTRQGLESHVRLHGVADFATELVPYARRNSDIFLSCHRQSDPSCSYLENMGCGLAIAGYKNKMWDALLTESRAGWGVTLGNWRALADKLATVDQDRNAVVEASRQAWDFSSKHLLEKEFDLRIRHIRKIVQG